MIVTSIMGPTHILPAQDQVEQIVRAAFSAFARGAGRAPIEPGVDKAFRRYFVPKACTALSEPDWADAWRREKPYVVAYAEALGRRAAKLACEDRRAFISARDVDDARARLRGYLPVAGRWCPS